ncbi:hypothetical protein DFH28DRAFT_364666 [Melampsora americana]|nr:hypothetical protein DFH28DRAFT_364666 [Melampsora americana]
MKTTTNQKENNKITQDEDLNQISQYLNIKTSSSKSLNPFELIHERFNSHSNLTSNQLHSISFNLTNYQNQLQLEFDSLHQQFINSQSDLLNSIQSTKTSLQTLKQQNEKTHESYLKSEDDLIDHFQNSNSIILTNTLSNQIQWLNQLQHLKVWYNLLLNVQKRSEEILKKTTKVEESIETLQNDLFEFFQHYSSFKFIEFETQSKLNLLDLIHQLIVHTIQTIIQTFSNELILSFEEELQWPLPIEQTLDLTTLSNSSRIFKAFKIIY